MLARMASQAIWARRVGEWRESGQTSEEFASGRGFSASGLRCAASKKGGDGRRAPAVAVAKVVRASATVRARDAADKAVVSLAPAAGPRSSESDVVVVLEVGGARLGVRRGCDAATLAAVFEAMFQRGGAR